MKHLMKIFSMVMALSVVLSCCVFSAGAVEMDEEETDEIEVFYLDDNIKVTVIPKSAVAGTLALQAGTTSNGTASPYAYPSYKCRSGNGSHCRVTIDNTDDSASMKATIDYTIPDGSVNTTYTIHAGDGKIILVENTSGADLTCTISVTIKAYRATSVDYSFSAYQY